MNKRLKHLYDLYKQEPTDLTSNELIELINAGIIEWHPCGDCCCYGDCCKDFHDCEYSYASVYTDDEILLYQKYLDTWYNTHDEGEPACINEWYDNEYQALNSTECEYSFDLKGVTYE